MSNNDLIRAGVHGSWRLNRAFAKYNLAACIKGGLELQGYEVGAPLPPQSPLMPAARAEIKAILREVTGK